jgi:hypothetical protein
MIPVSQVILGEVRDRLVPAQLGLSTVLGYSPCTRTCRESGSSAYLWA